MQRARVNLFLMRMRKLVPIAAHGVAGRFGAVLQGADGMAYCNQFEPDDTAVVSHIGGRGPGVAVVVDQCLTAYWAGDNNCLLYTSPSPRDS